MSGPDKVINSVLEHEPGGHRWQRIPDTEKRGRVHSSTITVAALPLPSEAEISIDPRDLKWSFCRGSGAGGQHRNVTDSAVRVTHTPTGVSVTCESERSQYHNKRTALALLHTRLEKATQLDAYGRRASDRRNQIGSGMRGDKRRTVRCQSGQVIDHITGRKLSAKEYFKGVLGRLHP